MHTNELNISPEPQRVALEDEDLLDPATAEALSADEQADEPESAAEDTPGESAQGEMQLRQQRLREYKSAALQREDPLTATLEAIAGDSMELHGAMTEMLRDVIESAEAPSELREMFQIWDKSAKHVNNFANTVRKARQDAQALAALAANALSEKLTI